MRKIATIPAVCLVAALTACSSGSSSPNPSAGTQCSTVLADGARLTSAQYGAGCLDGTKHRILTAFNCKDGRKLYGDGDTWGFVDDTLHKIAGPIADEPSYKAAYMKCTSP